MPALRNATPPALAACLVLCSCAHAPAPPAAEGFTNSLGMQMVRIPAGEFLMGNDATPQQLARLYPAYPPERLQALADEAPVHRVPHSAHVATQ
jgi:formylglycine-generating enzyme required for sulfatase activity